MKPSSQPTAGERIEAARARLYDALAPRADAERELIRWLTRIVTPDTADTLASMAERARRGSAAGVARLVLSDWEPSVTADSDAVAQLERIAAGGGQ